MGSVSSLIGYKERKAEDKLVYVCYRLLEDPFSDEPQKCGCKLWFVHVDASIECNNCGYVTKEWMENLE